MLTVAEDRRIGKPGLKKTRSGYKSGLRCLQGLMVPEERLSHMQGRMAPAGEQTTTKEETMINQKVGYVTTGKFHPTQKELDLRAKNKEVLMSGEFAEACKAAGIPETKRQASKFKNKRGLAYRFA